jgi:lipopolysaccharide export system protein LptA
MAKINSKRIITKLFNFRHFFYAALFLAGSVVLQSQVSPSAKQVKKTIELKNADLDIIERDSSGKDVHRLLGNVLMEHNEITMSCDSAHLSTANNQVKAYSRVHIKQGDTLDLYGNYLFYDGRIEIAIVTGNVELIDKETHLFTESINYDVNNRIARYNENGRITNDKNTLTSKIGVYYVSDNLFHFKDSVKIVNPDYVMTADTMDYNTKTETAFFTGPSELKGDSLYLYCEKGWYDTKNDVTTIWKNAVIDNRQQIIHGDSLFFDNISGFGQSFRNVVIEDTTNNLIVTGNYAWYYKQPEKFTVTDSAVFIQVSNKDSLFLHADTINARTLTDSTGKAYKLMRAYFGCRIFSKDLQAKTDSLAYSFQDSVIRFYKNPVIWSSENQLTSDSMAIFTKNRQTDKLELYSSAFITSQIDSVRFNQIKGRALTGYFRNNELYKIDIRGNGESIYYLVDGKNVAGVDLTKCANIEVLVEKGKISEIFQIQDPEGSTDPPDLGKPDSLRLKGFNWFDSLRPKNKTDIFRK